MSVELLQTLSLVSYIIAGILLLASVALFFLLDVPKLYGDISGRTAQKAIKAIRQQNERTGDKAYKPSAVNAARGKVTDKMTPSGRLGEVTAGLPIGVETEKLAVSNMEPTANETTVLMEPAGETTVLEDTTAGETAVLEQDVGNAGSYAADTAFAVEVEMGFTGSSELIE